MLWKKRKLIPRYVGPFEIIEMIYRPKIPEELGAIHDIFHVSNLKKKCLAKESLNVPLEDLKINNCLKFMDEPIEIINREVKQI